MHAYILLKKYCSTYGIQAYCLLKQQIRSRFSPSIFSAFPEISNPRIWLAFLRRAVFDDRDLKLRTLKSPHKKIKLAMVHF